MTPKEFISLVDFHHEGESITYLKKAIKSEYAEQFRDAIKDVVYRAWSLNFSQMQRLGAGETIRLKARRSVISYSWTKIGAERVTWGEEYPGSNGTAITKLKLANPNDILLNMYQFAKQGEKIFGEEIINKQGIIAEQEVILPANEYYLTIDPKNIVFSKPAFDANSAQYSDGSRGNYKPY